MILIRILIHLFEPIIFKFHDKGIIKKFLIRTMLYQNYDLTEIKINWDARNKKVKDSSLNELKSRLAYFMATSFKTDPNFSIVFLNGSHNMKTIYLTFIKGNGEVIQYVDYPFGDCYITLKDYGWYDKDEITLNDVVRTVEGICGEINWSYDNMLPFRCFIVNGQSDTNSFTRNVPYALNRYAIDHYFNNYFDIISEINKRSMARDAVYNAKERNSI